MPRLTGAWPAREGARWRLTLIRLDYRTIIIGFGWVAQLGDAQPSP